MVLSSAARSKAGRVLSGLAVAFLCFSAALKFLAPTAVLDTFARLQLPDDLVTPLAVLELGCTLVYALPRTALHGAILLTGYLGGAILAHWRLSDPLWTHTLFPLYVGAFVWGGLALRRPALCGLLLGRGGIGSDGVGEPARSAGAAGRTVAH